MALMDIATAPTPRCAQAELAVQDWLETQSRIITYWRDLLVSEGGDIALIASLDEHAIFLRSVATRHEPGATGSLANL